MSSQVDPLGETSTEPQPNAFIDTTEINGGVRLVIAGEIDVSNVAELRDALTSALDWAGVVELDMVDVGFIDSSGLGVLVGALNRKRDDQRLVVTQASRVARRLFEVTDLLVPFGLAAEA